ncbi:MAG: hypothetical protein II909_01540 [Kiritimatiellae bacterium]|nr:hypothetical protein [Kiritimatiellia bacterium]MBR4616021.1 hypothetical protein [Kiritimatiellia bacterium]
MNRFAKYMFMAALAAAIPAFAQEAEDVGEGAQGYTPILLGLASPVSIPYGNAQWDVRGVGLSLFYTDAPKVYGLNLVPCGAALNRDEMYGVDIAPVFTWCQKNAYGVRLALGGHISNAENCGVQIGGISFQRMFQGIDVELALAVGESCEGLQAAFIATCNKNKTTGLNMAAGVNLAEEVHGCQIAGIFNETDELTGCQIGLFNFAKECPKGLQIGLINVIVDNQIKALPFVNGYFGE